MTRQRPVPAADEDVAAPAAEDVLAATPAYAEWLAQGAALVDRRDKLAQQTASAQAAQTKADEDHAAAVRDAVRAGAAIPETPVMVDFSHLNRAAVTQRMDEQRHREDRATVVAAVADEVLVKLRQREVSRQERLVVLGAKLDELADEAHRDVAVVRDVLDSEDDVGQIRTYPTRATRVPTPDVVGMLAAAKAGRTQLDPLPMPPRNLEQEGMVQVDRDHPWQQHVQQPDLRGLER